DPRPRGGGGPRHPMTGPLRLNMAERSAVVGKPAGPADPWLTRLVKLVPAEVVAVYLAGRPFAQEHYAGWWPVACLVLTIVVRAGGTSDRRGPPWLSVLLSPVSFVLWGDATGGPLLALGVGA